MPKVMVRRLSQLANRVFSTPAGVFTLLVLLAVVVLSVFAPLLAPRAPNLTELEQSLQGPSWQHWLGTDKFGRDVCSRMVYGARVSLLVGLISQSISLVIGVILGSVAGYFKGWIDGVVMGVVQVVWAFPSLLFVIAITLALGPGIITVYIAVALVSWVGVARIVRGQYFVEREKSYVLALRARGVSNGRIMFKHILPNTMSPVIVVVSLGFAGAIVAEAGLSFLGLGVQPPDPSWGSMLKDGYAYFSTAWWVALFPGLAITLTVLAFNLLGDRLREVLDPKALKT